MNARMPLVVSFILALSPELALAQAAYHNPIDGRDYGPMENADSANPADTAGKKVITNRIVLLTVDKELKQRVTLVEMTRFIKSAQGIAYETLEAANSPAEVLVQFNCTAKKCKVQISNRGVVDRTILQELYDALSRSAPLDNKDEVVFQIDFMIRI